MAGDHLRSSKRNAAQTGRQLFCTNTTETHLEFFVRYLPALHIFAARFMATLKPFAALRPKPELAAEICELPYDVMSSEEARQMASGNPLSFLHVSKPEIDLPPATDIYSSEVYADRKSVV